MQLRDHILLVVLAAVLAGVGPAAGPVRDAGPDDEATAAAVRDAALLHLAERYPDHAHRLRVRVVRLRTSATSEDRIRLRLSNSEGVPRGHAQARLSTETASGAQEAGWAVLYVAHFDSVVVAARDLAAGDRIHAHDLGTAWMEVTSFRGQPMGVSALAPLRAGNAVFATQPIASGEALRTGDLRPPLAADTGERVTLTYHRGPILLRLTGTARQQGVVGDIVRVYSDATQNTYKARLTGPGRAEWVDTL